MKYFSNFLLIFLLFLFIPLSKGQSLEIHQLSIGHGDAGLIIVRDVDRLKANFNRLGIPLPDEKYKLLETALNNRRKGTLLQNTVKKVVLIDGGNTEATGVYVKKYLNSIGVNVKDGTIDYAIISHYDQDHYGGIKGLQNKKLYPDTLITRGTAKPHKQGGLSTVTKQTSAGKTHTTATFNLTDLNLGTAAANNPIQLTCVASEMNILDDTPAVYGTNDENDNSLYWLLQYGAFRYGTGGDLTYIYEQILADVLMTKDNAVFSKYGADNIDCGSTTPEYKKKNQNLKGHACSIKINHHGSVTSTSHFYLAAIQPTTATISCGYSSHGLPNAPVLKVLEPEKTNRWEGSYYDDGKIDNTICAENTIQHYFLTGLMKEFSTTTYWKSGEEGNAQLYSDINDENSDSVGLVGGNIVLVVNDKNINTKSSYYIFWGGRIGADAKKHKNDMCKPRTKGATPLIECHQATTVDYIKNH